MINLQIILRRWLLYLRFSFLCWSENIFSTVILASHSFLHDVGLSECTVPPPAPATADASGHVSSGVTWSAEPASVAAVTPGSALWPVTRAERARSRAHPCAPLWCYVTCLTWESPDALKHCVSNQCFCDLHYWQRAWPARVYLNFLAVLRAGGGRLLCCNGPLPQQPHPQSRILTWKTSAVPTHLPVLASWNARFWRAFAKASCTPIT